jgi:hypothetical protein
MRRGARNKQGARWWAHPVDDYELMCRAFDEAWRAPDDMRGDQDPPWKPDPPCETCELEGSCSGCARAIDPPARHERSGWALARDAPIRVELADDFVRLSESGTSLAASGRAASLGREASNVGSRSGSRILVGDFGAPKGPGCGSTPPGEDGGTRVGRPTGAAGARGAAGGGAAPAAESLRRVLAGVRARLADARRELRWMLAERHDGKVYDFDPSCRNPDCAYGCGERKARLRANTRSEIAKLDHLLRRERTIAVRITALSIAEAVDAAR